MPGRTRQQTGRRTALPNAAALHRQWLELVDTEGPFLAIPPLKRVWTNGMPSLSPERKAALVDARKDFEPAWEHLDRRPDDESAPAGYRITRDKWVETVLRDVAGWAESLSWGEVTGVKAESPNQAVTVTAQAALVGPDGIGALVHIVDPADSLRQTPGDLWAATPVDRLEAMLRESKIPIGIVTDGRWWGLVCAREGAMAASGIVDALTWIEEDRTRDAFFAVISRQHIIGGDPAERLPKLFEESVAAAEEITEALGDQVRQAVELLIQSFSESAAETGRKALPSPLPERLHEAYEAAVTVMMRVVFLLFAEERGLLPSGELFEQGYGISSELTRLANREAKESEESLDSTSLTWHRLLATSQALAFGASFENLRMPAYGGSLFDPARFPFLTAKTEKGTLGIIVSDRVMLHVLRSVQLADIRGDARQVSFRDIDVEQIGYIYEGLLGYTCVVVEEPYVGLRGKKGVEPEIPLTMLEALAAANPEPKKLAAAIRKWVADDQPAATAQSESAIAKGFTEAVQPEIVSALTQTVGDDEALKQRVQPWLGLIRSDLRTRPFVIREGGLLVKETPSRKNAGAHYTPKSLAEEVVLHALQPLCYSPGPHQTADTSTWELKTSDKILDLKVADIACGSGAFLVAAARYLADRVAEAWVREDQTNAHRKDLHLRAMREVVANCIYGADINDMAVEMCKLSLWLVSLDKSKPFSFVDDKIFCGNSLLGVTSLDQLRRLHIYPERKPRYLQPYIDVDAVLAEATRLRRELASPVDEDDPQRSTVAKQRLLRRADEVTARLRLVADGIVATGLALGGKPGNQLDDAFKLLEGRAAEAFPKDGFAGDRTKLDEIIQRGLTPQVETDYERWQPLHWALEVPDVMTRGGFDAIIGNPPFLGASKLSAAVGPNVREWFLNAVAAGTKGAADLVAYFFLRGTELANHSGSLGLIATNTVAQGDTREVGLDQFDRLGHTIYRSIQSAPWPSSTANLEYAAVWTTRSKLAASALCVADGCTVSRISTLLEPEGGTKGLPVRLPEMKGIAFKGAEPGSMAFTMTPQQARILAAQAPAELSVLKPFVNGEDLTSSPHMSGSRWIADFGQMDAIEARRFPTVLAWLGHALGRNLEDVRPWWRFRRSAPDLRRATADLEHVVALALVSKSVMPVRVGTGPVFSKNLAVFAYDSFADLAILCSSVHQLWAIKYSSTLETRVNYSPTDAFETFPIPPRTNRLESLGTRLDAARRSVMKKSEVGLTKVYNLVNDPNVKSDSAIAYIREIHVEMDEAVMAAYGWDDVRLDHGFHTYRQMQRFTVSPAARVEILDRLLEENHRRAGFGTSPAAAPEELSLFRDEVTN